MCLYFILSYFVPILPYLLHSLSFFCSLSLSLYFLFLLSISFYLSSISKYLLIFPALDLYAEMTTTTTTTATAVSRFIAIFPCDNILQKKIILQLPNCSQCQSFDRDLLMKHLATKIYFNIYFNAMYSTDERWQQKVAKSPNAKIIQKFAQYFKKLSKYQNFLLFSGECCKFFLLEI